MRNNARHPLVITMLERVLRDEAVHRSFGWSMLDALLALDAEGVRARVQRQLPATLSRFRSAYAVQGPDLDPQERELGLLDPREWRRIFEETVDGDVRRRFEARNITFLG